MAYEPTWEDCDLMYFHLMYKMPNFSTAEIKTERAHATIVALFKEGVLPDFTMNNEETKIEKHIFIPHKPYDTGWFSSKNKRSRNN